jgi:hypothetical protein
MRMTAARKLCSQCRRSMVRRREDEKMHDNVRVNWEKGRMMIRRT